MVNSVNMTIRDASAAHISGPIRRDGGASLVLGLGGIDVRAAVVIVTVTCVGPDSVTGFCDVKHWAPGGSPPQLRLTGWVNPAIGVIKRPKLADLPAGMTAALVVAVRREILHDAASVQQYHLRAAWGVVIDGQGASGCACG